MKRLLLLLPLLFAIPAHAGSEGAWGATLRVPTASATVTVANCTTDGTTQLVTTDSFNDVVVGMTVVTGGTLAIPTGATVIQRTSNTITLSAAAGTGTGTATFTFPPRVAPLNVMVVGGTDNADTSFVPLQFDQYGNLKVSEAFPQSGYQVYKPNWLNTVLTSRVNGALPSAPALVQDSTSSEDVRGCTGLAVALYPIFSGNVAAVAVAMQVRWHFTSGAVDTATAFIDEPYRSTTTRSNVALGHLYIPGAKASAAQTIIHSATVGEFSGASVGDFVFGSGIPAGTVIETISGGADTNFTVNKATTAGVNGVTLVQRSSVWDETARDSIGTLTHMRGPYTAGVSADSLAQPNEQVVVFTNVAGVNRGRLVRIKLPDGPSLGSAGPYLSVRFRYLNGYNANGQAYGQISAGMEPSLLLNAALLGWR